MKHRQLPPGGCARTPWIERRLSLTGRPPFLFSEVRRRIDKAVDEKHSIILSTKIYKRGTTEFKELAEMYTKEERRRNACGLQPV